MNESVLPEPKYLHDKPEGADPTDNRISILIHIKTSHIEQRMEHRFALAVIQNQVICFFERNSLPDFQYAARKHEWRANQQLDMISRNISKEIAHIIQ